MNAWKNRGSAVAPMGGYAHAMWSALWRWLGRRGDGLPAAAGVRIADIADADFVSIEGVVCAAEEPPIEAPISGRKVLWWSASVRQVDTNDRYDRPNPNAHTILDSLPALVSIDDKTRPRSFRVDDGSGATAVIGASSLQIAEMQRFPVERVAECGNAHVPVFGEPIPERPPSARARAFVEGHNARIDHPGAGWKELTFDEQVLVIGDKVRVLGAARRRPTTSGYRDVPEIDVRGGGPTSDLIVVWTAGERAIR